jgi:hypothetical protein
MPLGAQRFLVHSGNQNLENAANLMKISRSFFLSRVSLVRTAMNKMRYEEMILASLDT